MFISKGQLGGRRQGRSRGFTLVELLVTISIFVILTGLVLFSQAKFNGTILLTNLAYDTALTIREAQTYGINIKNFTVPSGISKFTPYGVHFDRSADKSFILFADVDYDPSTGLYSGVYNESADLTLCEAELGCVNRYNITRGNHIVDLCLAALPVGTNACPDDTSVNTLDITFVRPNPDAKINNSTETSATIILGNADDTNFRKVEVSSNGLIQMVR